MKLVKNNEQIVKQEEILLKPEDNPETILGRAIMNAMEYMALENLFVTNVELNHANLKFNLQLKRLKK